jgi:hypothetical protein
MRTHSSPSPAPRERGRTGALPLSAASIFDLECVDPYEGYLKPTDGGKDEDHEG